MIDIHTHILYGVDDGAKDLEMSLELLEEAKKVGFDKIVFSSHYMEGYFTANVEEREKIFSEINNANTTGLELYLGNEIIISEDLISFLHDKKAMPINNTKYVLFELPFNIEPINLMEVVYKMQSNDFVPILAHPERYPYLYEEPSLYEELVGKGVLLQTNFGSYIGQYGRHAKLAAEKLLKNNLVHILATDAHRPNVIYPDIPEIIERITELVGKEKVEQLTITNPEKVLNNEDIEIEDFEPIKWSFFEKRKIYKK